MPNQRKGRGRGQDSSPKEFQNDCGHPVEVQGPPPYLNQGQRVVHSDAPHHHQQQYRRSYVNSSNNNHKKSDNNNNERHYGGGGRGHNNNNNRRGRGGPYNSHLNSITNPSNKSLPLKALHVSDKLKSEEITDKVGCHSVSNSMSNGSGKPEKNLTKEKVPTKLVNIFKGNQDPVIIRQDAGQGDDNSRELSKNGNERRRSSKGKGYWKQRRAAAAAAKKIEKEKNSLGQQLKSSIHEKSQESDQNSASKPLPSTKPVSDKNSQNILKQPFPKRSKQNVQHGTLSVSKLNLEEKETSHKISNAKKRSKSPKGSRIDIDTRNISKIGTSTDKMKMDEIPKLMSLILPNKMTLEKSLPVLAIRNVNKLKDRQDRKRTRDPYKMTKPSEKEKDVSGARHSVPYVLTKGGNCNGHVGHPRFAPSLLEEDSSDVEEDKTTANKKSVLGGNSEEESTSSDPGNLNRNGDGNPIKRPTKVTVRLLPPSLTKHEFVRRTGTVAPHNYFALRNPDAEQGRKGVSTVWINFLEHEDALEFIEKVRGVQFVDERTRRSYFAHTEYSDCQTVFKTRRRNPFRGTLHNDPHYQLFLQNYNVKKCFEPRTTPEQMTEQLLRKQREKNEVTAPLTEFILRQQYEKKFQF